MKNKKRTWRLFFALCIFLYVMAIGLTFVIISNVPNLYVNVQERENKEIDNAVLKAAKQGNKEEYQHILDNYLVDFAVYNETKEKLEYSSINLKDNDISLFKKNVNERIVSNKKKLSAQRDNEELSLLVVDYYVSPQQTFDIWIIALIVIVSLLLSLIAISLVILFFKYVKPLGRLKNAIQNISAFQLNVIDNVKKSSEYDSLTSELYSFSKKLDERIKDTGYKYSELEQSLILQNEEILYRNKIVGSLAHDLKGPLSLINLNLEKMKETNDEKQLILIQEKVNNVIEDINGLNKIAFNGNLLIEDEIQSFDLIQLLLSSFDVYKDLLVAKGLFVEFELAEKIIVKNNKVRYKQLIDNFLANIYNHADENGDVVIEAYLNENEIILSFYNDAEEVSEIDIDKITNLFYSKSNKGTNSGIGMYTIKTIVDELKGRLVIKKQEKGLMIMVVLYYDEENERL